MILLPFSLDGYSAGYGLRIVIIFKKERGSNEIGNRSKETNYKKSILKMKKVKKMRRP